MIVLAGFKGRRHLHHSGQSKRIAFLFQDPDQSSRCFIGDGLAKSFLPFYLSCFLRDGSFFCAAGKRWPRHIFNIKAISQGKQMVGKFDMLPLPHFRLAVLKIPQLPLCSLIAFGFVMRQLDPAPNGAVVSIIVRIGSPSASIHFSQQEALDLFNILYPISQLHQVSSTTGRVCKRLRPNV